MIERDLARCRTPGELRDWLRAYVGALDFDDAVYLHIGHWGGGADTGEGNRAARFVATTDDEQAHRCAAVMDHGVVAAVRSHFAPFAWPTASSPFGALAVDLKDAVARGASVITPVQDHAAGPAYMALVGPRRVATVVAADLAFAAARFHDRAKLVLKERDRVPAAATLTRREIECLRLAALGRTVGESGRSLGVTARTVEFHLKNAADKLGATTKVRAVAVAVTGGLIQL